MSNTETATMMENNATAASTTQYEMVEQLAHKCNVSLEEAKSALETNNWNVLSTTHQLEQEAFKRKQELNNILSSQEGTTADQTAETDSEQEQAVDNHQAEAGGKARKRVQKTGATMKKLGQTIMDLIKQGNRNRFVIHRNGEQLVDMPVTILVPLLLGSVGTCAFLMVVGLFLGCRYTINGIGAVEA